MKIYYKIFKRHLQDDLYDLKTWALVKLRIKTAWKLFTTDDDDTNSLIGCMKCGLNFDSEYEDMWGEKQNISNYCPQCGVKLIFNNKIK